MPRPRKMVREEMRSETRQRLLEAAAVEFAREGYNGANINRISQTAGFAKGTIYNYFPSKRALMLGLIDEVAAAHLDFIVTRVLEENDPARRVTRFFEAGFAFVSLYLAPSQVMVNTLHGPDVEFKAHMYQAYQPLFQFVAVDIVGAGIAKGVFRPVDAGGMAQLLMIIYLGTGSAIDEDGRHWLDPRQVADFALNGLCKQDQSLEEKE
jgi:AcrR family transcriptional regulator